MLLSHLGNNVKVLMVTTDGHAICDKLKEKEKEKEAEKGGVIESSCQKTCKIYLLIPQNKPKNIFKR